MSSRAGRLLRQVRLITKLVMWPTGVGCQLDHDVELTSSTRSGGDVPSNVAGWSRVDLY